jgi:hypothetical protein
LLSGRPPLSSILKWPDGESGNRFSAEFSSSGVQNLGSDRRICAYDSSKLEEAAVRRSAEPSRGMGIQG